MVAAAVPFVPRMREEKNLKYANDGSLESVDAALRKMANKFYCRVEAVGIGMTLEDVYQELCLGYVQARAAWNPQGGALFATYCITVCQNNFNAAVKKMERQRTIGKILPTEKGVQLDESGQVKFQRPFGMVLECEMTGDDDDDAFTSFVEAMPASDTSCPEYRLERAGAMRANFDSVSPEARKLIGKLLQTDRHSDEKPRLAQLAREVGLEGRELRRVKLEILGKFGVTWQ